MPTIIIIQGFSFFFYSNEHEPMHVHIEKDNKTVKFNLIPIDLIKSKWFKASELIIIRLLVEGNLELFKQKWDEYFYN